MNIYKKLSAGLIALTVLMGASNASAQKVENSVIDAIHARTSVRTYSDKPIEKSVLTELVKAGMAAPSGGNRQPWEFIVVTDRAMLDKLATKKKMLKEAQAAIIVAGHSDKKNITWQLDCSAATQNILLAAHSVGLGAVWTTVHPHQTLEVEVRDLIGMPEDVTALNIISIGYPKSKQTPKQKWNKSKLHLNRWAGYFGVTKSEPIAYDKSVIDAIHSRSSVRAYSNKAVSNSILVELVKAGMAAPSGVNKQPWEFVVITDKAKLNELASFKPSFKTAQAAIIVAGHNDPQNGGSIYWYQDCSAATQNILLAAHSFGLGAVWNSAFPIEKFELATNKVAELPQGVTSLCAIAIGYPAGAQMPKNKWDENKVHYNKWSK